jgi:hypothetical protein
MPESPLPTDAGAPAPSGPDAGPQVQVELGPDPSIYADQFRPPVEPAAPPVEPAPEPDESAASDVESDVAGAADQPSPPPGETRGTRRRAAEEAYQRGLVEGRAVLEREQAERQYQDTFRQTQLQANQRIEQLFSELGSPDYATQDRARQGILQLYTGNRQAAALMASTRQQVLQEMAADFASLGTMDGLDQDGFQTLHSAPSAAELAKRAFDLGKKTRDEQVARLEAEVQGLRGRLVGSRATPEMQNGSGPELSNLTVEQYLALSPKEAAKLSSAQIDAMTAQLQADAANGRNQG